MFRLEQTSVKVRQVAARQGSGDRMARIGDAAQSAFVRLRQLLGRASSSDLPCLRNRDGFVDPAA